MPRTELIIGQMMRAGLFLSMIIVSFGGIFYLSQQRHERLHYSLFQGEPAELTSLAGVWHQLLMLSPTAVIQFGILVLVLTQILRVALTAFYFIGIRDYFFAGISLAIFGVLVYSFLA